MSECLSCGECIPWICPNCHDQRCSWLELTCPTCGTERREEYLDKRKAIAELAALAADLRREREARR